MTDALTPQEKMATIICRNHGHESAFIEPPCMVAHSTADALIAEARASTDAELLALREVSNQAINELEAEREQLREALALLVSAAKDPEVQPSLRLLGALQDSTRILRAAPASAQEQIAAEALLAVVEAARAVVATLPDRHAYDEDVRLKYALEALDSLENR